jgi:hypothetical protein
VFIQAEAQSFEKFKVGRFFVKHEHVYRIVCKNHNVITVRDGSSGEYFKIDLDKETLSNRIDCVVEEGLDPTMFMDSREAPLKSLDTLVLTPKFPIDSLVVLKSTTHKAKVRKSYTVDGKIFYDLTVLVKSELDGDNSSEVEDVFGVPESDLELF